MTILTKAEYEAARAQLPDVATGPVQVYWVGIRRGRKLVKVQFQAAFEAGRPELGLSWRLAPDFRVSP